MSQYTDTGKRISSRKHASTRSILTSSNVRAHVPTQPVPANHPETPDPLTPHETSLQLTVTMINHPPPSSNPKGYNHPTSPSPSPDPTPPVSLALLDHTEIPQASQHITPPYNINQAQAHTPGKQSNDTDALLDTLLNIEQELCNERDKYKNLTQTMPDDCASFEA